MRAARPGDARSGTLEQELAFPYHPHVTVAHHLDEAALDRAYETLADYDCTFEVADFHLYSTATTACGDRRRGYPLVADRRTDG